MTVRLAHTALCCPAGNEPNDNPAPLVVGWENVTPDGAVDSFTIVCSVPFTAAVPTPISTSSLDDVVLELTQITGV